MCRQGRDGGGIALWAHLLVGHYVGEQRIAADPSNDTFIYAAQYAAPVTFEGVSLPDRSGKQYGSIMVARLRDSDGSVVWAKFFGGPDAIIGLDNVVVRSDRHILLTGGYGGAGDVGLDKPLPFVPDSEPLPFVALLSPDGAVEASWAVASHAYGEFTSAAVHGNDVYLAGEFAGDWLDIGNSRVMLMYPDGGRYYDALVAKFDANLEPSYFTEVKLPHLSYEYSGGSFENIAVDPPGNVYMAVHYQPQQVIKFNSDGRQAWTHAFDSTELSPWQVVGGPNEGILVSRSTPVYATDRLASDGGLIWEETMQGAQGRIMPGATTIGTDGRVYVSLESTIYSTIDLGLGPIRSSASRYSGGSLIAAYDEVGTLQWARAIQEGATADAGPGALGFFSMVATPNMLIGCGNGYGGVNYGFGWTMLPRGDYPFDGTGVLEAFTR